jgi:hypothetical protein
MNIGVENRNKLIALGVLALLAVVLIGRMLFGSGGSTPTAAAPVSVNSPMTTISTAARMKARGRKVGTPPRSLDPSLRYDWLKTSEDTKYEGNGRNIFLAQAEIPQPIAPAQTEEEKEAAKRPPPPPPPPPINLKFFGFASKPGEPKKIFLSQGEDVFIASEGEMVDRHYKVLHISPMSVEIEDVLNNNRQSIPLTQG